MMIIFLLPDQNFSMAPELPLISEAVHVFTFFILTWFLVRDRLKALSTSKPGLKLYLFALLSGMIFGVLIEILQHLSGMGRTAEFLDVIYDTAGCLLSMSFLLVFHRLKKT